jgi:hypothetical protein
VLEAAGELQPNRLKEIDLANEGDHGPNLLAKPEH